MVLSLTDAYSVLGQVAGPGTANRGRGAVFVYRRRIGRAVTSATAACGRARVGIGYRSAIAEWTRANLERFDVLEVTVDHCIQGSSGAARGNFRSCRQDSSQRARRRAFDRHRRAARSRYLDEVANIVDRLHAPTYSEHLAFTRVPGRDLANLLPLPRTEAVAEMIVAKVRAILARVPVPFLLENISYVFEWPDSHLSDAAFLNLICGETGAGLLLDVENLYLNATNHGFDALAFLDELSVGLVREVHMAGGITLHDSRLPKPFLANSHSHPIPVETLELLEYALVRHDPATIVLERDDRLEASDEILGDVERIRACVNRSSKNVHGKATVGKEAVGSAD